MISPSPSLGVPQFVLAVFLSDEGGVHVSGHSSKSRYLIELATSNTFSQLRSSTQEGFRQPRIL
jgi:hypothetical protein